MAQIGFTDKQAEVYRRFNALRRAYEDANGGGRVYNPDFLSVLMDAWVQRETVEYSSIVQPYIDLPAATNPVSLRAYIADRESNDQLLSVDPRIGKRVRCLYGNSGNKFYSDFLDTCPTVLDVRKNEGSKPDSFKLGEAWWYCNDFEILEPENETGLQPVRIKDGACRYIKEATIAATNICLTNFAAEAMFFNSPDQAKAFLRKCGHEVGNWILEPVNETK